MGHRVGMQGAPMIRGASYGAQGGDSGSPYDQGNPVGHGAGGMQGVPVIRGASMGHRGGMQGAPMIRGASYGARGGREHRESL